MKFELPVIVTVSVSFVCVVVLETQFAFVPQTTSATVSVLPPVQPEVPWVGVPAPVGLGHWPQSLSVTRMTALAAMETPQATQVASVNLIVNLSPELSWFAKPLVDVNVADVELSTEAEDGAPPGT